jgi:hypothetical protein
MGIFSNFLSRFSVERLRNGDVWYWKDGERSNQIKGSYLDWSLRHPVLMPIIALRSKNVANMQIQHLDKNGEPIANSPILKLLKKPNYFQTQQDFIFQSVFFMSSEGANYIYTPTTNPLLFLPSQIYNLKPDDIDFNNVDKVKKLFKTDQEFKEFGRQKIKYHLDGKTIDIEVSNLIPIYDLSNGLKENSMIRGVSRIKSIERPLLNIEELLLSKNTNAKMSQKFLAKSGNTYNGVATPLGEEDKKAVKRIIAKDTLHVTNQNVDVTHLVNNLKNLALDPQISSDAQIALLTFGLNNDVLNFFAGGSSTYENQERGEIRFYQNEIQNIGQTFCDSISQHFGLFDKGEKLTANYDHLPIMQKVMVDKVDAFKKHQESIKIALENQTITSVEAMQMTESFIKSIGL